MLMPQVQDASPINSVGVRSLFRKLLFTRGRVETPRNTCKPVLVSFAFQSRRRDYGTSHADPRASEGNDGPWSTFDLRVGTPEQYIRVLVSTASPFSLVPYGEEACSTSVFETVPPNCAVARGGLFNSSDSSTWQDVGLYGINQNGVGLEANLGYEQRVQFGLDRLGIGLTGPELDNQTVGGIATAEPFYL